MGAGFAAGGAAAYPRGAASARDRWANIAAKVSAVHILDVLAGELHTAPSLRPA